MCGWGGGGEGGEGWGGGGGGGDEGLIVVSAHPPLRPVAHIPGMLT